VFPTGTITFAAGETSKALTINVLADTVVEGEERFKVTLANPKNATLGSSSTDSGVINNDDAAGVINIGSTTANTIKNEGGTGGGTPFIFNVTRSNGVGVSSVGYTVAGWASGSSTAASAADFVGGVLPAGTITFAAGETSKLLTINVLADTVVEGEERFKVTLANPKNATLGSSSTDSGVINNDDVPVGKVDDIFRVEGSKNGDGSTFGIGWAGKIRVMADFSKAVYSVRPWEVPSFNDVKPYSDQALESLTGIGKQGWMPVDLNPLFSGSPPIVDNIAIENRAMIGGFYTSGNSAAFLARCGDAIVISFRGTNDNGTGAGSPDVLDWVNKAQHYDMLRPLVSVVDSYVVNNNIRNVYVTGHSLGGAMAIKYMDDHLNGDFGANYESIVFASASYDLNGSHDDRMTLIEIEGDPVADTGIDNGRNIHFQGNKTLGSSIDNHSMDYYRQIVDSIDNESWGVIMNGNSDRFVNIGARKLNTVDFIVDGMRSGVNSVFDAGNDIISHDSGYNIYYGGRGDDVLFGLGGSDTIIGGVGNDRVSSSSGGDWVYGGAGNDYIDGQNGEDVLEGGNDNDTLVGGIGKDTMLGGDGVDIFRYYWPNDGGDTISDFRRGTDKIQVVSSNFAALPVGTLSSARLLAGNAPTAQNSNAVFLYDTSTGTLTFDSNGSGLFGSTTLAVLTGSPTLLASDIQIVMT
jgi:Ca2+-binding RTX toxin-like protein